MVLARGGAHTSHPTNQLEVLWAGEASAVSEELERLGVSVTRVRADRCAQALASRAPDMLVLSDTGGAITADAWVRKLCLSNPELTIPIITLERDATSTQTAVRRAGHIARLDAALAPKKLAKELHEQLQHLAATSSARDVVLSSSELSDWVAQAVSERACGLLISAEPGGAIALGASGEVAPDAAALRELFVEAQVPEPRRLRFLEMPKDRLEVASKAKAPCEVSDISGAKIVVVHANSSTRESAASTLSAAGAEVLPVGVDAGAFADVAAFAPSLIVVDAAALIGHGIESLWEDARLSSVSWLVIDAREQPALFAAELVGLVSPLLVIKQRLQQRLARGELMIDRVERFGAPGWLREVGRCATPLTLVFRGATGRGELSLAEGKVRGAKFLPSDGGAMRAGRDAVQDSLKMTFGRVLVGAHAKVEAYEAEPPPGEETGATAPDAAQHDTRSAPATPVQSDRVEAVDRRPEARESERVPGTRPRGSEGEGDFQEIPTTQRAALARNTLSPPEADAPATKPEAQGSVAPVVPLRGSRASLAPSERKPSPSVPSSRPEAASSSLRPRSAASRATPPKPPPSVFKNQRPLAENARESAIARHLAASTSENDAPTGAHADEVPIEPSSLAVSAVAVDPPVQAPIPEPQAVPPTPTPMLEVPQLLEESNRRRTQTGAFELSPEDFVVKHTAANGFALVEPVSHQSEHTDTEIVLRVGAPHVSAPPERRRRRALPIFLGAAALTLLGALPIPYTARPVPSLPEVVATPKVVVQASPEPLLPPPAPAAVAAPVAEPTSASEQEEDSAPTPAPSVEDPPPPAEAADTAETADGVDEQPARTTSIHTNPAIRDVLNKARDARQAEDYEQAEALLQEALSRAPDDFNAQYQMALTLVRLRRFEDARQHLERAKELASDSPLPWLLDGDIHLQLGELHRAVRSWEGCLRARPGFAACEERLAHWAKKLETRAGASATDGG